MGENKFTIHKPEELAAQQEAFKRKLAANQEKGHQAYKAGNVEGFPGYTPEKLGNEYEFKIELTDKSQQEILERAVGPLEDISKRLGIPQVYPGNGELPPHITLEVAKFQNVDPQEKAKLLTALNDSTYLDMMVHVLKGLDIGFDSAVASGRDTYICASEFNTDVYPLHKARNIITRVMNRTLSPQPDGSIAGLMPVNYKDIVHSTIGRMSTTIHGSELLQEYEREVAEKIARPLAEKPIKAQIDNVYHGSALSYHKAHNSPQLKL